ncbi:hypothetical protein J2Z22_001323 [Paenibacillus forsythiae]|uniref:DUF202 domain-containing protein n=1 Tax=Paenibacillus forsythiae TaxID=365616 RepID=A0ABU3H4Q1_9BACL|nr:hypothetical protein [Paenibacillus forsythiae]MDT3425804.1 hypothetical protein [Paenibacillus forsythiae]
MKKGFAVTAPRYSIVALASSSLMLLLHTIHWLLAPALAQAAHQHAHAGQMDHGGPLTILIVAGFLGISAVSVYCAVRQLAAARSQKHRGGSAVLCSAMSVVSIGITGYTLLSVARHFMS